MGRTGRLSAAVPGAAGRLLSRPRDDAGPPRAAGTHVLDPEPGVEAALTVPDRGGGARPLLVFCHGAGGSAADSLARVGRRCREHGVLLLATTSAGTTWDLLVGGLGRDVAVLDAALDAVFATEAVSRTAIGGFSDGGSYALCLGLANGDLADTLLAFSPGFSAPPARVGTPRVWVSHGTADRVLPVDRCGRRVVRDLAGTGTGVRYDEFDGGHELPDRAIDAALDWWLAG